MKTWHVMVIIAAMFTIAQYVYPKYALPLLFPLILFCLIGALDIFLRYRHTKRIEK